MTKVNAFLSLKGVKADHTSWTIAGATDETVITITPGYLENWADLRDTFQYFKLKKWRSTLIPIADTYVGIMSMGIQDVGEPDAPGLGLDGVLKLPNAKFNVANKKMSIEHTFQGKELAWQDTDDITTMDDFSQSLHKEIQIAGEDLVSGQKYHIVHEIWCDFKDLKVDA